MNEYFKHLELYLTQSKCYVSEAYVCIYIHIFACAHTHTYIYIFMYTYLFKIKPQLYAQN